MTHRQARAGTLRLDKVTSPLECDPEVLAEHNMTPVQWLANKLSK